MLTITRKERDYVMFYIPGNTDRPRDSNDTDRDSGDGAYSEPDEADDVRTMQ